MRTTLRRWAMKSSSASCSHDGLGDAGLPGEGEGLERPPLGHLRALDAGLDAVLALVIELLAQQAREEVAVARVALLGAGELARDDRPSRAAA
jgi:hypothetical protein